MKRKIQNILTALTNKISSWESVNAIVRSDSGDIEIYDLYFNIDIDVYFDQEIPSSNKRRELFGSPAGFETSPIHPVDYFSIDELPITIRYKTLESIDLLLRRVEELRWTFRHETTNVLYRLDKGLILFKKSDWLECIKERLSRIPAGFWEKLKDDTGFYLDASLRDIGAAVYREDFLFFHDSVSRFLQCLCSFLYAVNKKFEPSRQLLYEHMQELKDVPEEFWGRFDNFISSNAELPPHRKYEIAKLLVKSLTGL